MNSLHFLSNPDSIQTKSNSSASKYFLPAAVAVGALVSVAPANAQSAITVADVSAQTAAATTAITAVGATLIAMGFGVLVFTVSTNVIRRVMGG